MSEKLWTQGREWDLPDLTTPLALDLLSPGRFSWEVEIGFGKGRYLLGRANESPEVGFLGVEVANAYYRLAVKRAGRRRLDNVVLMRGEALYLMATSIPEGFAEAVHVYFPDPWPKARHQKRRIFDPETIDLVLRLLQPGGTLYFATDFSDYGEAVRDMLSCCSTVRVTAVGNPWPDGARTNYESKYIAEGRPITRLEVVRKAVTNDLLHPNGAVGVTVACRSESAPDGI